MIRVYLILKVQVTVVKNIYSARILVFGHYCLVLEVILSNRLFHLIFRVTFRTLTHPSLTVHFNPSCGPMFRTGTLTVHFNRFKLEGTDSV